MSGRKVFVHSEGVDPCPVCDISPQVFAEVGDPTRLPDDLQHLSIAYRECVRCDLISLVFQEGKTLARPRAMMAPPEIELARNFYKLGFRISDRAAWANYLEGVREAEPPRPPPVQLYEVGWIGAELDAPDAFVRVWRCKHPEGDILVLTGDRETALPAQASEIQFPALAYPPGTILVVVVPEETR